MQNGGAGTPTVAQMAAVAGAFGAFLPNLFLGMMTSAYAWGQIEMVIITGTANGQYAVDVTNGGSAGGADGTNGPVERALVIRKHTGLVGRRQHGRNYIPGVCVEAFDDNGIFQPSNVDNVNQDALRAGLLAAVTAPIGTSTITLVPVIWHASNSTSSLVVETTLSSLVGIQRRRRLGIGI